MIKIIIYHQIIMSIKRYTINQAQTLHQGYFYWLLSGMSLMFPYLGIAVVIVYWNMYDLWGMGWFFCIINLQSKI